MSTMSSPSLHSEKGLVLILFSALAGVIITLLSFSVDLGKAHYEKGKLQIAADAAAIAALDALGPSTDYSQVLSKILSIADANSVSPDEVTTTQPRCGTWRDDVFVPQAANTCDETSTAVEVTIQRSVPATFAQLLNTKKIDVKARSVSYRPPAVAGNCIRPFGVEKSFLSTLALTEGDTFSVRGTQEAGNWGKIDLFGNASSGTQYTELMLNNVCDEAIAAGNFVSAGTGDAQISHVFETLLQDTSPPHTSQNMVFAVTTDFPNGNGTVQILEFIRLALLSQKGNGNNWSATFQILELNAEPEKPEPHIRELME